MLERGKLIAIANLMLVVGISEGMLLVGPTVSLYTGSMMHSAHDWRPTTDHHHRPTWTMPVHIIV